MLLRTTTIDSEYEVVGDCYIHGVMDGEGLLGTIPPPWCVTMSTHLQGYWSRVFQNTKADIYTTNDPRWAEIPIPPEWEPIDFERTVADPTHCVKFRNRNTGEIINSDPRLFPEALIARGVPLKTITLV
jgi:hypothetical protein